MGIRLVVCMDFDTDNLEEAYRELRAMMAKAEPSDGWESSDEWFDADGRTGDVDELSRIRLKVLDDEQTD